MTDDQLNIILAEFKLMHTLIRELRADVQQNSTDIKSLRREVMEMKKIMHHTAGDTVDLQQRLEVLEEERKPKQ